MKGISSDIGTVKRKWASFSQRLTVFSLAIRRKADFPGPRTHRAQSTLHPCFWWWRAQDWIRGQALPRQSSDQTLREFPLYPLLSVWSQVPGCEEWNSFPAWWVRQLTRGTEVELCVSSQGADNGENDKTTSVSLAVSRRGNKVNYSMSTVSLNKEYWLWWCSRQSVLWFSVICPPFCHLCPLSGDFQCLPVGGPYFPVPLRVGLALDLLWSMECEQKLMYCMAKQRFWEPLWYFGHFSLFLLLENSPSPIGIGVAP